MPDLSVFLGRATPAERTDQYVILAAMFVLKAHVAAIPASDISKLLKLHLVSKSPTNIRASLRRYKAYASPVAGSPLKWRLTPDGIAQLQELTGLDLSVSNEFESDVGIICALEFPELDAVLKAFGGRAAWREVGDPRYTHVYRETTIATESSERLRLIATTSTTMGLTAAAIATTQLVNQYRPRLVAMVGIAAGTHSGGKQFGDILVADPSVDYNSGKVALENGIREFQPDPYPIGLNTRVRSVLQRYSGTHELFVQLRRLWSGAVPDNPNRLYLGPVGAADQVIDDPTRVLEIQKNWRKLIGVEMETYGVYRAVYESPEPKPRAVSFKAVCDFAANKSDSWQEYAAFMAAGFAAEFIKREWANLWPKT